MKVKYKIKQVKPNIFAVVIKDYYHRAMTFMRSQEYYESPNKKFRGVDFDIWDYIEWYSREHNGNFTYAADWGGFNIPFDVAEKCLYDTFTPYDEVMWEIIQEIKKTKIPYFKGYIIGIDSLNSETFDHELCHGLYYTEPEYRKLVDEITLGIDPDTYAKLRKNLLNMHYTEKVIDDEIQAYLSTNYNYSGFCKGINKKVLKALHKQYAKVFKIF